MAGKFDPLHTWLGIPPAEQPPNYYRVFGLKLFESDPAVITAASNRVIHLLQGHAAGPHGEYAKKLLPNLVAIRKCLLDPQARASYDAKLRAKTGQASPQREPAKESPQGEPVKGSPPRKPTAETPRQPQSAKAPAASLTRAKPLAAPPPPPAPGPPPAPAPPPVTAAAPPALEAAPPPAAEPADWAGEGFEPEPFQPRSSAGKRSKRGRAAGKSGSAKKDQAGDSAEAPAAKKGSRRILIGAVAVVLLAGLGGGGFVLYRSLASGAKTSQPLAQATEKTKLAEPAEITEPESAAEVPAKEEMAADSAAAPLAAAANAPAGKSRLGPAGAAPPLDENATAVDPADEPLLQLARDGGPVEKVMELIRGGANIETADAAGRTLFRLAVMGGHIDLVDALLDKNVQVNTADILGQTPLMSAAQRGDVPMVEKLLAVGADPNLQSKVATLDDTGGLTALLVAIRHDKPDVVKLLIDGKADINQANGRGVTPLMLACWRANPTIVQMLMVREPQVGATDDQGQTALMYAVQGGKEEIVKQVLFSNDARVYVKSLSGATPLGIALAKKSPGIVAMLRDAAKKESPPLDF